jgi:hypothetical protein
MSITFGDYLIDSGYYDITPEQERERDMSNDGLRTLDEAEEQIERMNSRVVELMREVERLQHAKRAALKIADERAIEAVALRAKWESARKALEFYRDGWVFKPRRSKTGIDLSSWEPRESLMGDYGERARTALTDEEGKS